MVYTNFTFLNKGHKSKSLFIRWHKNARNPR